MAAKPQDLKAAVYYGGVRDDSGPREGMTSVLYRITGSFVRANSIYQAGKGVVVDYIHPEAAKVFAHWIEAEGGIAEVRRRGPRNMTRAVRD
jgi:hypothetical protein